MSASETRHEEEPMTVGVELVRALYAHASWSTGRVFEAAAGLDPTELAANIGAGAGSVLDTLAHLVGAQRTWLARAEGRDAPGQLRAGDVAGLAGLRGAWAGIDAETRRFVDGLGEADLGATVCYVNSRGRPNAYSLWQVLAHQAHHQGQHRAEAALALTRLGHSPGWLDLLFYVDLADGLEP
jgi:uncharacterized damage-inducible protein DinB